MKEGAYIFSEDGGVCGINLLEVGRVEEVIPEGILEGPELVEGEISQGGCSHRENQGY